MLKDVLERSTSHHCNAFCNRGFVTFVDSGFVRVAFDLMRVRPFKHVVVRNWAAWFAN
jgi:hypothetical protein